MSLVGKPGAEEGGFELERVAAQPGHVTIDA